MLGINKTRTTPYHPWQVERYNRTLLSLIRCRCGENPKDWDKDSPSLAGAMRAMINRFTEFSANMLMLGREAATPVTLPLSEVGIRVLKELM